MHYGYARVSSKEQNLNRQIDALQAKGIAGSNVFMDKESGKDFKREKYKILLKKVQKGDCIVFTSLDRLGRNYREIQKEWQYITRNLEVDIIVLDMPLLNTTATPDNLTGRFIADLVLQILSYVAETERTNIRKRQAEGIAAAKERGVQLGRKNSPLPDNFYQVVDLVERKIITVKAALKLLKVSRSWFYVHRKACVLKYTLKHTE